MVKDLTIYNKSESLVEQVQFILKQNEVLGIVGESGSGKSLICRALLNLLPKGMHVKGEVLFEDKNILTLRPKELNALRGQQIAMIIQNPMTAFSPIFTIGNQLIETVRTHTKFSKEESKNQIIAVFKQLLLKNPEEILKKYPHELSGGMLQRIVIATTILMRPKVIIADEPTTALDSITQLEVIEVIKEVQQLLGCGLIIVSHDLGVISSLAQNVLVMQHGQQIEYGTLYDVFSKPTQPYTQHLFKTKQLVSKKFENIVGGEASVITSNEYY